MTHCSGGARPIGRERSRGEHPDPARNGCSFRRVDPGRGGRAADLPLPRPYGWADGAAVGATVGAGGAPHGAYGCSSDDVQAP